MRQLVAVGERGTLSAAAKELHISQPALSRSIQRLEAELGTTLFDRIGRAVILNDAGRAALEGARAMLRDERFVREAVRAVVERSRALRVATIAPAPLWRLTALMVERFPQETLISDTKSEDEVLIELAAGTADLGIVRIGPTTPGFNTCELMRENLFVALPPNHPLAARKSIAFADLADETFLIMTNIGFWRGIVDRAIPRATYIEQADRMVFSQLARTTPYCTFTTDAPFQRDILPGRAIVPITDEDAHAVFRLVVRADAGGIVRQLFDWTKADRSRASLSNEGFWRDES